MLIGPVNPQTILDEVIGPDAEKIHFPGQRIGNQNCCRNFNHNPQGNVRIVRDPFFTQFFLDLKIKGFDFFKFLQA